MEKYSEEWFEAKAKEYLNKLRMELEGVNALTVPNKPSYQPTVNAKKTSKNSFYKA